eukprot:1802312-Lingulodinium_polyedra.AAC.1
MSAEATHRRSEPCSSSAASDAPPASCTVSGSENQKLDGRASTMSRCLPLFLRTQKMPTNSCVCSASAT